MEKVVFLKPSDPDVTVIDPVTHLPIDAQGEEKPLTIYWRRRLAAGEVVETAKPKAAKPSKTQES